MAEGIYLPGERRFDMIAVPLSVIDPLAEALARTTCEQINSEGVLRIVAFSKSLNGHGFDIADALLVDIVSRLKAVENAGRCVEELTGELRELLPEILVRARIRPIKEESGVWSILTDEDVPLQKRGKRFAWLVDDEEL
jgi:hypothetical protein